MLKRCLDAVVATGALIVLSPLLLVLWLLIRASLGSPAVFAQPRPGLHGKVFTLYKFRSMTDAHGADGNALPDAERLTRFGRLLRSTSLDELPSLWNVLRGDMSLVGPRPLLVQYLELYSVEQARRHEVRPGLTGWAQIHGRNQLDWDDRFRLDVWYVDHRSFGLDLKILFLTLAKVLRREGVSGQGSATMTAFEGSSGTDKGVRRDDKGTD